MWTDLQAFFVWSCGDGVMLVLMLFLVECFLMGLIIAGSWAIRNLRP